MRTTLLTAFATLSLLAGAQPAGAQSGHDLFQQALVMERANGQLQDAILLYERIAEEFSSDRELVARALVQLGGCYEKLGSTEAERAYRRVVREFADQEDLVVQARSRLEALQQAARASEEVSITTRRLWAGMNAGAHDASPDGRYLVWSDFMGTMNLALREVATGENRFLTHDGRLTTPWANSYAARISPDGNWVAHGYSVQDEAGSLRVVGIDGANLRELRKEAGCWVHPYEWTSDSRHIAARWACWSEANPQGRFTIVLVSVADGSVREVHELPNVRKGFRAWLSPDDRYLVYGGPVEQDDGNADIWILPLDGGEELSLIQHPADDRLLGWVPGTDQILFLSDRDGTWDLWAASVSDAAIVGRTHKVRRDMGEVDAVGFAENGALYYSVFTRWFNMSVAPFDLAAGTADLEAATPLLGSNRNPHWSPDAEYLAFVSESGLEGKMGTINIRHLATGEQRELATHLRARFLGDWSPDGRSILVVGVDATLDRSAVYAVNVESEEVTPLLDYPDDLMLQQMWADWSADGEAIFYSANLGSSQREGRLVRRELTSGEERELYRVSALIPQPLELSPDGHHLLFTVEDSMNTGWYGGLTVLDLETGATQRIVANSDSMAFMVESSAQWTPDGMDILYTETIPEDERRTLVWRVAADGGEPEHLWTTAEGKYGSWFELSPDGRRIAITTYTQENEIWVIEGLKEVLTSGN